MTTHRPPKRPKLLLHHRRKAKKTHKGGKQGQPSTESSVKHRTEEQRSHSQKDSSSSCVSMTEAAHLPSTKRKKKSKGSTSEQQKRKQRTSHAQEEPTRDERAKKQISSGKDSSLPCSPLMEPNRPSTKRKKRTTKSTTSKQKGMQRRRRSRNDKMQGGGEKDPSYTKLDDQIGSEKDDSAYATLSEHGQPSTKRRKGNKTPSSKQQWTELTAAGHILADEVHLFSHPQHTSDNENEPNDETPTLSSGEQRQLTSWVDAVQKRIHQQNGVVLENVKIVSNLRKATSEVRGLRDDLMVLSTQTRGVKQKVEQLEKELQLAQQEESARRGAERFLDALENLAAECSK